MLEFLLNFIFIPGVDKKETAKVVCSENKCALCGKCQKVCPENAIMVDDSARIYYSYRCSRCKNCISECPSGALFFAS
jgi:Fe-S-cluster-containing hydrogenase component 2